MLPRKRTVCCTPVYSLCTVFYCHDKNGPAWSVLYNITVEILRALTIKLTQARARSMAMARAMVRTRDRPRLRTRAMVSSRARAWAWECVYV